MYKRVQNNFVNSVISTIVSANRSAACKKIYKIYASKLKELKAYQMPKVKIYQMPKLTLVGTTVTDIESGKQIFSGSIIIVVNNPFPANDKPISYKYHLVPKSLFSGLNNCIFIPPFPKKEETKSLIESYLLINFN